MILISSSNTPAISEQAFIFQNLLHHNVICIKVYVFAKCVVTGCFPHTESSLLKYPRSSISEHLLQCSIIIPTSVSISSEKHRHLSVSIPDVWAKNIWWIRFISHLFSLWHLQPNQLLTDIISYLQNISVSLVSGDINTSVRKYKTVMFVRIPSSCFSFQIQCYVILFLLILLIIKLNETSGIQMLRNSFISTDFFGWNLYQLPTDDPPINSTSTVLTCCIMKRKLTRPFSGLLILIILLCYVTKNLLNCIEGKSTQIFELQNHNENQFSVSSFFIYLGAWKLHSIN